MLLTCYYFICAIQWLLIHMIAWQHEWTRALAATILTNAPVILHCQE